MKKLIALSALIVLSANAFADGKSDTSLSYDEISAGYVSQSFTDSNSGTKYSFTGYGVGGSRLLTENIYVLGSYSSTRNTTDFDEATTVGQTQVGIGYRYSLNRETDLNSSVVYISNSFTGSSTGTGYGITLGVRSLVLSPDIETSIHYVYLSQTQDGTTETSNGYSLSAKYMFSKNAYTGISYMSITDSSQYTINVGYKF